LEDVDDDPTCSGVEAAAREPSFYGGERDVNKGHTDGGKNTEYMGKCPVVGVAVALPFGTSATQTLG